MRELLFPVRHGGEVGLQTQLRRHLVGAILDGRLSPDNPLPSGRRLAHALGVSRNTVVLAYQALADEGFLHARERVGYFVNAEALARAALDAGVVIEPGTVHFRAKDPPRNYFRLGFSSIPAAKIGPGIQKLAQVIDRMG